MLRNPNVEKYYSELSAHSDVAEEFLKSLKRLGDCRVSGGGNDYAALYAVTNGLVFCAAAGMSETYWRLRPSDVKIAKATGANRTAVGPEWMEVVLFRPDWPQPDIAYWALRAYDFARTGR
jgi:hypothetical protein